MKRTFVQCADILLGPGADAAAPGGAVTLALCGSWEHPGPCRWPHETATQWDGDGDGRRGRVRTVFTADAAEEAHVRALIEQALAGGECTGPDGKRNCWEATEHGAGVLSEREADWGAKRGGER